MDQNTIIIGIVTYLLTSAWGWLVNRFSDKGKAELAQLESYVPIVAKVAAAAFPSLGWTDIPNASATAMKELRSIVDKVGLHPSDAQWAHLETLVNGVLLDLFQSNAAAARAAATHDLAHSAQATTVAAASAR